MLGYSVKSNMGPFYLEYTVKYEFSTISLIITCTFLHSFDYMSHCVRSFLLRTSFLGNIYLMNTLYGA